MTNPPRPVVAALAAHGQLLTDYVQRHLPASLRGSVDPADVVQDVCYEALLHEATFRPELDPDGRRWLCSIARSQLTRRLRRKQLPGAAAAGTADVDDPLVKLLEELTVYLRTPSQSAASHETIAAVHRSIARLSPDHAAVIRSRYLDQLSAAEVADRSGRTLAAVNQLLYRAMASLRVELTGLLPHA